MSSPQAPRPQVDARMFKIITWSNFGIGAFLVMQYWVREVFSRYSPGNLLLIIGLLLLLTTLPTAKLRKFGIGGKPWLVIEFYDAPKERR